MVDTYGISYLDFDIEGAAVADAPAIALHSQALALLQQSQPDLQIWYALPVLPTGLTADGLNVVDSALKSGVALAGVNVMAMDYGDSAAPTSGPNAQSMAPRDPVRRSTTPSSHSSTAPTGAAMTTANSGHPDDRRQRRPHRVFTVTDAQTLENFARVSGLGMLSMWSIARDTPGSLGQATPSPRAWAIPPAASAGLQRLRHRQHRGLHHRRQHHRRQHHRRRPGTLRPGAPPR